MAHAELTRMLLFDVDATLIHSAGAGMAALGRAVLHVCGETTGDPDALAALVPDGMTDPVLVNMTVQALCGRPTSGAAEVTRIFERYIEELGAGLASSSAYRVLPGVPALLSALGARPTLGIGLGTGNIEPAAKLKLERGGLWRHFAFGGYGSDAAARATVLATAHARGERWLGACVRPGEVLVIGDSVRDVEAARANGFRSLGTATGRTSVDSLREAGATLVVPDLLATEELLEWMGLRG